MATTRREFLEAGAALLSAGSLKEGTAVENGGRAQQAAPRIPCLDYARSFLCGTAAHNSVRFWVESRTSIFDDRAGTVTDYYQCASCKSEDTFAKQNLFYKDNYDFLPILGDARWLIFRRPARLNPNCRQIRVEQEVWGLMTQKLYAASPLTVLETWEQIRDATAAGLPIVSQTEIAHSDTGLRAAIECPVKTMNIGIDKRMYQVDTGPVGFPDLTKRYDPPIDCLQLAFVAFNAPDFADFVVEQPTPVVEDGVEKCKIHHYSSPFSLPAKNRLLALGKL